MAGPKMAFAYLRSDTQALPLIAGHTHTIGRKPECDLCLKSRSVSGQHAVIEVDADGRSTSAPHGCLFLLLAHCYSGGGTRRHRLPPWHCAAKLVLGAAAASQTMGCSSAILTLAIATTGSPAPLP